MCDDSSETQNVPSYVVAIHSSVCHFVAEKASSEGWPSFKVQGVCVNYPLANQMFVNVCMSDSICQ